MAIFLGVCVAACFGSGDFLGGLASKRLHTLVVLALAQICALGAAVVYVAAFTGDPTGRDLAFGGVAGGLNLIGLGVLFHGLATGRMGVVAPVTAVVSAVIPVAYGTATGERPSTIALIGVVCAIGAAGLIAAERSGPIDFDVRRELALSVFAGVLFGTSLILYTETTDDSGFWPVLAARAVAVPLVLLALLVTRTGTSSGLRERRIALGAGLLDVTATALLLLAVREGLTSLVAPLAALGPAFTVAWAWIVLKEPIARLQIAGLGLGLVGLALIAAG
ncbi:MAG: EamA family transporter [Acidimicrobiia bacterium]